MDETFSSIDLVTQCLLDSERTELFGKVIRDTIKPDHIVLDSGTGSGILSLFAAKAGAKKVISVEYDPYVARLAHQNIINNGYENVIDVRLGDVRNMNFENGIIFDVVIMEMLTTGMVDEYQVWTINNLLKKGYVNEKTIFIPFKQDTSISLLETDFNDYGFKMRMVKHLWSFLPRARMQYLAQAQLLNSATFNIHNEMGFKTKQIFEITQDGVLNSIYLTSETWLSEKNKLGDTLALNAPVIYPLDKDIEVKIGDKIEVDLEYDFGNGYRNFKVEAKKL